MNDACAMCLRERAGDLDSYIGRFAELQTTLAQAFSERLPFNVLTHDVRHAVVVGDGMDRNDGGMRELRGAARLAQKARLILRRAQSPGVGNLDCHPALER